MELTDNRSLVNFFIPDTQITTASSNQSNTLSLSPRTIEPPSRKNLSRKKKKKRKTLYTGQHWYGLPQELRFFILELLPVLGHFNAVKHVLRVNKECNQKASSEDYMRLFLHEFIKQNVAKALNLYARMIEIQDQKRATIFFKNEFIESICNSNLPIDYVKPELANDESKAKWFIERAMVHNKNAIEQIFLAAKEQDNQKLLALFAEFEEDVKEWTLSAMDAQYSFYYTDEKEEEETSALACCLQHLFMSMVSLWLQLGH